MNTEKAIAGALRSTIDAHGPITKEWIGSATKRIMGQLRAGDKPQECQTCGLTIWDEDHECPPGFTT